MVFGQHPEPTHVIAHLSDVHLLADGRLQYDTVNPEAGLVQVLDRLSRISPSPQVLVFTGDLADRAEPAAYARLRELVEPAAASMGAEIVWVMGNHDERSDYSLGLFGVESDEPQDRVYDVAGLRVIALDTTVTGYHHGEISDAQFDWLRQELATAAPHGTVLALHHPPIPLPMLPAAEIIELYDQHRLAEIVEGSDIREVIGGHFHYSSYSTFAGVPVSVASASCYTCDPAPLERYVSGVDGGQSFTMMHVYADQIVHTVVPLAEAPEVSGFPADAAELIMALSPDERREEISRKDSAFNSRTDDSEIPGI